MSGGSLPPPDVDQSTSAGRHRDVTFSSHRRPQLKNEVPLVQMKNILTGDPEVATVTATNHYFNRELSGLSFQCIFLKSLSTLDKTSVSTSFKFADGRRKTSTQSIPIANLFRNSRYNRIRSPRFLQGHRWHGPTRVEHENWPDPELRASTCGKCGQIGGG